MTDIYINDLIYAISSALDYIEAGFVGISPHHSKRVAYISASLGKTMGLSEINQLRLAAAAALHDNALSEYRLPVQAVGSKVDLTDVSSFLSMHCEKGEENVSSLPFYEHIRGAVKYHHENADGSGPFSKTYDEIPMFARIVHIADTVDANLDLSFVDDEKYKRIKNYVNNNTGKLFDAEVAGLFLEDFHDAKSAFLDTAQLDTLLESNFPDIKSSYTPEQIISFSDIFSKIIDYKSSFTCSHSSGIAEKALKMSKFYGWDEDTGAKLYLAGALHDVGKLAVDSRILEKPSKLTDEEYKKIQNHAYQSYLILRNIRGLEEEMSWGYLHHEKLDGSGYPFGKTADELSFKARLLACLDIYQALVEPRPYKDGFPHSDAMKILTVLGEKGQLDKEIIKDIDKAFA